MKNIIQKNNEDKNNQVLLEYFMQLEDSASFLTAGGIGMYNDGCFTGGFNKDQ